METFSYIEYACAVVPSPTLNLSFASSYNAFCYIFMTSWPSLS